VIVYTLGHSTLALEAFVALVRAVLPEMAKDVDELPEHQP